MVETRVSARPRLRRPRLDAPATKTLAITHLHISAAKTRDANVSYLHAMLHQTRHHKVDAIGGDSTRPRSGSLTFFSRMLPPLVHSPLWGIGGLPPGQNTAYSDATRDGRRGGGAARVPPIHFSKFLFPPDKLS